MNFNISGEILFGDTEGQFMISMSRLNLNFVTLGEILVGVAMGV